MRIVFNILIVLMVAMLLAGVAWHHREHSSEQERIAAAREAVNHFHRVISLQATLNNIDRSIRGYPLTVELAWFEDELPSNPLLGPSHPWLEIAHPDHDELLHPPLRAASNTGHAQFWYNPANGIVRARVPRGVSDGATLRLYNAVNGTNLTSLLPESATARAIADLDDDGDDADDDEGETGDAQTGNGRR